MKYIADVIDVIRDIIRNIVFQIAKTLNKVSKGNISPNAITISSLLIHIPIAILIAKQLYILAGISIIIFGLFDTLDGSLARIQKIANNKGMLLDASTDRMKEVILYCGAGYAMVASNNPKYSIWAIGACGASLLVSYIKAKGETAFADKGLTANQINKLFVDGIMRFEVRMAVLILGLFTNQIKYVLVFIAVSSSITALGRLITIYNKL